MMSAVRNVLGSRLAAIAALLVVVFGLDWIVRLNVVKGLNWSVSFSIIAALAVMVVLPGAALVRRLLRQASGVLPLADTTLAQAREDLAQALAAEWDQEERLRRVNDPWPLPVRWSGEHAGEFEEIGQVFARLPSRRMVILGSAGAGKSALAVKLVRQLLRARQPGDPVPVLLSAATWTHDVPLTEWVATQLALDHPGLAVRVKAGTGDTPPLAASIAASGVLPVIDGLDELPEYRRAEVVAEINRFGSNYPVVLTSRPGEYDAATAARTVALASVILLEPLTTQAVRSYLEAASEAPLARWDPVFAALDAEPDGPLAQVLTNPLMVWLARTVYERGPSDPSELTVSSLFAEREAIEGHLLAGFVPAAYAPEGRAAGFRCSPAQAQRWLGFLAAWQDRAGSQDIAWWRLGRAERAWSRLLVVARTALFTCVAWWAVTWALTRRGYWRAGAFTGHGHYRALALAGPLGRSVAPLTLRLFRETPGFDRSVDKFMRGMAVLGLPLTAGLMAALGLYWSLTNRVAPGPLTPRVTTALVKSMLRRWAFIAVLAFLWWFVQDRREPIPVIASLWRTHLLLIWIGILSAGWVLFALAVPVNVSSASGPADLLRRTRWVYLLRFLRALTAVASAWLWLGTALAVAIGVIVVARYGVRTVLGGPADAWPSYREARFRLAVRRRLPWRTQSFLADAHRRGVLRQLGAVYQFRHILLQKELAAGYSAWPPLLAPLVDRARAAAAAGWQQFCESVYAWSTDDIQKFSVTPDSVSAVIAPGSLARSMRYQLHSDSGLAAGAALLAIGTGIIRWYAPLLTWLLIALVLLARTWFRRQRYRTGLAAGPHTWAVRLTAETLIVSYDDATASVGLADIERVAARRVRTPDGLPTHWIALQARLRPDADVPLPVHERWLPLVWLTTKYPISRNEPLLRAVIRWFPAELLGAYLTDVWKATATGYSAAAEPEAESAWSLRVTPDRLDVTMDGVAASLAPDDVETVELRPWGEGIGLRLRPRPGVTAPAPAWLRIYGKPAFVVKSRSAIPTELIAALHGFAGGRFGPRLAELAKQRLVDTDSGRERQDKASGPDNAPGSPLCSPQPPGPGSRQCIPNGGYLELLLHSPW
jgi:NACHT domain